MRSARISMTMAVMGMTALIGGSGCGGGDGPGPHVDRLAPEQAVVGEEIDILGTRFCPEMVATPADAAGGALSDAGGLLAADVPCATTVNGFVTFGTAPGIDPGAPDGGPIARGRVTRWTATRISVTVPQLPPGQISVLVTANGVASNAKDFEVLP